MVRISVDDGAVRRDLEHLKERVPAAAEEASLAATKEFGEQLRRRVISMIPDKGGWYDIYKSSIVLNEVKPGHWELTTIIRELSPAAIPAETSLIWLATKRTAKADLAAAVVMIAANNPWTIDSIPAVAGGLPADAIIKPASPGEVEHFRRRRLLDRKVLDSRLKGIPVKILDFDPELPTVDGRVLADVPFLALRLEYGYGGFSKTPIWSRIDMEGEIISRSKAVQQAGHGTFASRWRQSK